MPRLPILLLFVPLAAYGSETGSETDRQLAPLLDEVEEIYAIDKAGALELIEQGRQLLLKQPAVDADARFRALQCWLAAFEKPTDEAIAIAEDGLAFAAANNQAIWAADLSLCRGYIDELAGHYDLARPRYDHGVGEGRRLNDTKLLADALTARADLLSFLGEYADAMTDYKEAYPLYLTLGKERAIRATLGGIANLYSRLGEHDKALEYFKQLLTAAELSEEPAVIGAANISLGHAYTRKKDFQAALSAYTRASEMYRSLDFPGQIAVIEQSLGATLLELGQHAAALPHLEKAIALNEQLGDNVQLALTRVYRGQVLQGLGRSTEAMADLDAAVIVLREHKMLRYLADAQIARARMLADAGRWDQAYQSLSHHLDTHLQLDQNLREESTAAMRVQFDTEKKEQENALLQKEKALSEQALAAAERIRGLQAAVIALAVVLLAIIGYLAYRQVKATRRMQALALTDELTRLPNRRHILTYATDQLELARDNQTPLSVLVFDVDYFKRINDGFGHLIGDRVLQRIANACNNALREGDKLGRTGGEEFMAVLPGTGALAAADVAERLRQAVEDIDYSDLSPDLRVTISLGVCEWEDSLADIARLSHRADNALYRAKERGRNRVEVATAKDDQN